MNRLKTRQKADRVCISISKETYRDLVKFGTLADTFDSTISNLMKLALANGSNITTKELANQPKEDRK